MKLTQIVIILSLVGLTGCSSSARLNPRPDIANVNKGYQLMITKSIEGLDIPAKDRTKVDQFAGFCDAILIGRNYDPKNEELTQMQRNCVISWEGILKVKRKAHLLADDEWKIQNEMLQETKHYYQMDLPTKPVDKSKKVNSFSSL